MIKKELVKEGAIFTVTKPHRLKSEWRRFVVKPAPPRIEDAGFVLFDMAWVITGRLRTIRNRPVLTPIPMGSELRCILDYNLNTQTTFCVRAGNWVPVEYNDKEYFAIWADLRLACNLSVSSPITREDFLEYCT